MELEQKLDRAGERLVDSEICETRANRSEVEIAKLAWEANPPLFAQDPDSAQIAYSQSSMSICAEAEPVQKSSDLASQASCATPSQTSPPIPEAPTPVKESSPGMQGSLPSRYDTLIRFAAVELEGIIK
jgi:hypothetical protein